MQLAIAVTLATGMVWPLADHDNGAPQAKVTFLRGSRVMSAAGDGSGLRELVQDERITDGPKWSRRGDKIAYTIRGEEHGKGKTFASLVVLDAEGQRLETVPIYEREPDGTGVLGFRFVDVTGWYGDDTLFAQGRSNPHVGEYRLLLWVPEILIRSFRKF